MCDTDYDDDDDDDDVITTFFLWTIMIQLLTLLIEWLLQKWRVDTTNTIV